MKTKIVFLLFCCSIFYTAITKGQIIETDNFDHALKIHTDAQLIDIRTKEEYNAGHIPHAISAPFENKELFTQCISNFDKTKPVYLYCANGNRSLTTAQWLRSNGFAETVILSGGFNAWKAAGKSFDQNIATKAISDKEYLQMVSNAPLVLIDFSASWCPPCQKMQPVIDRLAEEFNGDLEITTIDGGMQTLLMQDNHVNDMPGFILYRGGKEVWRREGIISKEEMEAAIKQQIIR